MRGPARAPGATLCLRVFFVKLIRTNKKLIKTGAEVAVCSKTHVLGVEQVLHKHVENLVVLSTVCCCRFRGLNEEQSGPTRNMRAQRGTGGLNEEQTGSIDWIIEGLKDCRLMGLMVNRLTDWRLGG